MTSSKIILAGGSGFLGQVLATRLAAYDFIILCRNPKADSGNIRYIKWDGKTLGDWQKEIDNSLAIINLTGRSVDCRYNEHNRKEILESRINATAVLGKAIQQSNHPPALWINAASATIYRYATDRPMDELTGEYGDGFSVNVCREWEDIFNSIATTQTRKVVLRISMVLGEHGGVLPVLQKLVKSGLGGKQGKGNQYISWIHEADFADCIRWVIDHKEIKGTYNCAAPHPIPNAEFMQLMRKVCNMPFGLPATEWMLELGAWFIRTETELVLKSRRVIPAKLESSGFRFKYPTAEEALTDLIK
jgi:uncharacterized protein